MTIAEQLRQEGLQQSVQQEVLQLGCRFRGQKESSLFPS